VLLYRIDVKSKGRVTREAPEIFSIGENYLFSKRNHAMTGREGLGEGKASRRIMQEKGLDLAATNKRLAMHCK
jgi:hypothetical protein